jgi:uncharacterized iron-regulated membrane protein
MEERRDKPKPEPKAKRNGWARRYKFFWSTHKWTGIIASLILLNLSVTGILLLVKKRFEWIQPPTQKGVEGNAEDFITISKLVEVVLSEDHPAFQSFADIDRVDFRPGKRVHKVRSVHDHAEIQVDAVTGEVLEVDWRPSDLIESLHDGSFFGGWVHDYLMPMVAVSLMFLVGSGLYLWLSPWWKKR